jgi:uncharacterized membrane protein
MGKMNIIQTLKKSGRLYETIFMLTLAFFCFATSMFRCVYTKTPGFIFLNWNLFLAFLPWALTSVCIIKNIFEKSKIAAALVMLLWLLFFPNAPYVLTDLLALRKIGYMPLWYDLLMILSFAWTSLLFGFLSLWDIERILNRKIHIVIVKIISTLLLFIGSFGVYIGRFLRWNSWDIIIKPNGLIGDIIESFANPAEQYTTWGMTIFMGVFLNMLYWSIALIRSRSISPKTAKKIPGPPAPLSQ